MQGGARAARFVDGADVTNLISLSGPAKCVPVLLLPLTRTERMAGRIISRCPAAALCCMDKHTPEASEQDHQSFHCASTQKRALWGMAPSAVMRLLRRVPAQPAMLVDKFGAKMLGTGGPHSRRIVHDMDAESLCRYPSCCGLCLAV